MAHARNRAAFANLDGKEPGFRLYCSLVALELCLKDATPTHIRLRHQVGNMIRESWPKESAIQAALLAFEHTLGALVCTGPRGTPLHVRSDAYPDLRYLRHSEDFQGNHASSSSQASVQDTLMTFQSLLSELKNRGLTWP